MTRPATLVLMALNLLLAGLLLWLWLDPNGTVRGVHWQPPAAIRPDLGSLSAASIQRDESDVNRFMAILDRPVFAPTRRPPPPPPPPKPVVPVRADPLDTIHLYGLFSSAGAGGVIARVEGKTRRVKVSEAVGDWRLKEIRPRDVVFTKGGESRIVPLVQAGQATGAPPPRPAVAAPAGPPLPPAATAPQISTPVPSAQPPAGGAAAKPGGPAPSNPFVIGGSR